MRDLSRCWLGFPLPKELSAPVKDAQMQVKRRAGSNAIRWLPPGEVGIILVSLGEIATTSLVRFDPVISPVIQRHSAMNLILNGVTGSPSLTMPKTAWLKIEGDVSALVALRQDLYICARPLIKAIDDKPYEPGIELGRLRTFDDRARTEMGRSIKMAKIGEVGSFTMDAVHVLRSEPSMSGPSLKSIKTYPLSSV